MIKYLQVIIIFLFLPGLPVRGERPNVVLILADDLGYGDLSCYGASLVETPQIDRLARQGRRFTDAYSPSSVCTPTRYNLLTGRYAWRSWAKSSCVWANDPLLIDPERFTLADLFRDQGYKTACLGKWHLGFGNPEMPGWDDVLGPNYNRPLRPGPLECGFDYFWGVPHVGQFPHVIIENHQVLGLDPGDPLHITPDPRPGYEKNYLERPRNGMTARLGVEGGESARYTHEELAMKLTDRAVAWLKGQSPEQPFFFYFAHRNIHGPLIPNSRFRDPHRIGVYGDFLEELDWSVGQVLDVIDSSPWADNTLVLFTSDNGAVVRYAPIDRAVMKGHYVNGPLRGQKTDVYEGGVRVPLLARWPGRIPAGTEDDSLIALTDFLATFADLFQRDLPENAAEDSFSFLGALLGRPPRQMERSSLVCDSYQGVFAIREGDWKLIMSRHGGGANSSPPPADPDQPSGQLYHLRKDLAESKNLYQQHPDIVDKLEKQLRLYRESGRSAPCKRHLSVDR